MYWVIANYVNHYGTVMSTKPMRSFETAGKAWEYVDWQTSQWQGAGCRPPRFTVDYNGHNVERHA